LKKINEPKFFLQLTQWKVDNSAHILRMLKENPNPTAQRTAAAEDQHPIRAMYLFKPAYVGKIHMMKTVETFPWQLGLFASSAAIQTGPQIISCFFCNLTNL
jgi:hypothetical protein